MMNEHVRQQPYTLADVETVARLLGVSTSTVHRLDDREPLFPRAMKLGNRKVWPKELIEQFVQDHPRLVPQQRIRRQSFKVPTPLGTDYPRPPLTSQAPAAANFWDVPSAPAPVPSFIPPAAQDKKSVKELLDDWDDEDKAPAPPRKPLKITEHYDDESGCMQCRCGLVYVL